MDGDSTQIDERRGSLLVVGTGITGVGQTTLEARAAMERAEQLFYLVLDPLTEMWIRSLNPTATSFGDLYATGKPRSETYREMTDRMVKAVREGQQVCAAFYGHPGVFVECTHAAIRLLRAEGFPARMLPGVSSDGCLVADLGFNPGAQGVQSYEATEFLLAGRVIDPTGGLLLWQVGVLGETDGAEGVTCRPERLRTLTDRLLEQYPATHGVVIYYAPIFPAYPPVVERLPLESLPDAIVYPLATLYVPALPRRPDAPAIARWLREAPGPLSRQP